MLLYVIFLYHVCESWVRNLSNEQYPDMIYAYHLIINMFNPLPLHNIPVCVIWLVLAAFLDFSFFLYVSSLGPKQARSTSVIVATFFLAKVCIHYTWSHVLYPHDYLS